MPVVHDVNDIARWCARRMPVPLNEAGPAASTQLSWWSAKSHHHLPAEYAWEP